MTLESRQNGRIPLAGILLALGFGALLLWPAVALGDSLSRGAPPVQYRGPSGDVQGRGSPILDGPAPAEAVRSAEGWNRWEFWFEHEKDALVRAAMARARGATATGPAGPAGADGLAPPTDADVANVLLPALRAALKDPSPPVRAVAAMALGNARDGASAPALAGLLAGASVPERRAAALGLGFLGGPAAVPPLARSLEQDPDAAVRALAAVALGLAGDPSGAPPLRSALARSLEASGREAREIRAAAITGLGLLADRSSVLVLQRVLRGDLRDDRARAHAATALGRMGDPAAVPPLVAALAGDADASVRRSAALALGAFRDASGAAALLGAMESDGDELVRCFAAVSYARAAGADATARLVPLVAVRNDRSLRGFAAIALGLTGDPAAAAPVLRALLEIRSEDSLRGAAAVGLGLLGDRGAVPALSALARDSSASPDLRGYALLGAALTGSSDAAAPVREALAARGPAELRRSAALAAGVRPFPGSPGLLVRSLLEDRAPVIRGASLLAIGLAPDRGAIPLLADIAARDSGADGVERAEAVAALGQLSLRGVLPPAARLSAGVNYRDLTAALDMATRVF